MYLDALCEIWASEGVWTKLFSFISLEVIVITKGVSFVKGNLFKKVVNIYTVITELLNCQNFFVFNHLMNIKKI